MKRNERYNNDRGAALISVMIAVTFITIVASALLYMAYMNYEMKAISVKSKSNFYETEGYLQGVTVKLQDNVANMSSGTSTYLATFKDGASDYDCKKLLALKYPSVAVDSSATPASASVKFDVKVAGEVVGQDTLTLKRGTGASYTVAPLNGDPNSKTQVHTFSDVTIVQETYDGLTNNIKTDIVYYVTEDTSAADAGGVGEFSLMVDGTLTPTPGGGGSQFSFMTFYGNNFLSDTIKPTDAGNTTGKTCPGHGAIVLGNNDRVNFAGKYTVVYGDIVLNGSSCICVTSGNLCVYGDIILNDQSTLICSGKIYMVDSILSDYGRSEAFSIKTGDGSAVESHLYPSSLTPNPITIGNFNSFATQLKYNDSDADNDGFLKQILEPDGYKINDTYKVQFNEITNSPPSVSVNKYGMNYGWQVYTEAIGNGTMFDNKLTFATQPLTMQDSSVNSTVISKFNVTYGVQHGFSLKKIGPEAFKRLNVKHTDPTCDPAIKGSLSYAKDGNNFNGLEITAGDFFIYNCDQVVNTILGYAVNGEGGGTPIVMSSLKFENWVKDSE